LLASDFQFLLVLCADPSAGVHASIPSGDLVAALLFARLHFFTPGFSAVANFLCSVVLHGEGASSPILVSLAAESFVFPTT
jgi:hypothetical protein